MSKIYLLAIYNKYEAKSGPSIFLYLCVSMLGDLSFIKWSNSFTLSQKSVSQKEVSLPLRNSHDGAIENERMIWELKGLIESSTLRRNFAK